ncbi:MAG TPA: aminotransferase class I/II-fold pyridoxal phosphate-dependent enzyme [Actinomycetota bacterium]|jgi:aspartate aminotransferase|nr:aminotransferase class I/II-fold pyridoxal phosphate-dependent enzyme [Actinomycetota bacterium]
MGAVSKQTADIMRVLGSFREFGTDDELSEAMRRPEACDFVYGNPHDVAPKDYVDALVRAAQPTGSSHYAYTMDLPAAVASIGEDLRARFPVAFHDHDIHLTNGNFVGLAIALRTLVDPGDEVIFVSPPWFFYETLIVAAGATPVRVLADRDHDFDLDLGAIEAAITPRTRAIIVNSPNNPSGRIYRPEQLTALATILEEGSTRSGHRIYLLSDEAYNRIVFEPHTFTTPAAYYPHSFLLYTYAKTLLSPGSRLGYLAVGPDIEGADDLRAALQIGQITLGWAYPVSILQHAIPELNAMRPDIPVLQRRRDTLVSTLREQGYEVVEPQGTFYVLVRSPIEDDRRFAEVLRTHDVFVLPGGMFEMPGWFRLSVTANDDMVERSLPGFAKAIAEVSA